MKHSSTVDDALEVMAQILIRCTVIGIIVLLIWWGVLELAGDFAYRVHASVAPMSRPQFEIIHYGGMLITKAGVSLLFFFPYIAIRLVIRKRRRQSSNPAPAAKP